MGKIKEEREGWTRHTVINMAMIGKCYSVYNGDGFVPVTPSKADVGRTLLDLAMGGSI